MEIYSVGSTHKSASEFFETVKTSGIQRLVDVRLSNAWQLAGFTKQDDLAYFLRAICGIAYEHELLLAPSEQLFRAYRKGTRQLGTLASAYVKLLKQRKVESVLSRSDFKKKTVLAVQRGYAGALSSQVGARVSAEVLGRDNDPASVN